MDNQDSKKSFIDKVSGLVNREGQQPKPVDPSTLVNSRTQSMVISDREQAERELQLLAAQREQVQREQTVEAVTETAKKTGVYVIIISICVILLILVAILVFTLIPYLRRPTNPEVTPGNNTIEKTNIGFYECLTKECQELVELPDGRTLIKDGNYVILDQENEESFTTTISGYYESATVFEWGDKLYAHVLRDTGVGAIFSLTDNKYITSDSYELIYSDVTDEVYSGQTWIMGQYIIAKRSGDYRMVDIKTGKEMVQGTKGVFATKNGYFIAYDESGSRRAFNGSNIQIAFVETGDIYTRDDYLVTIEADDLKVYNKEGTELDDYSFKGEIDQIDYDKRAATIAGDNRYSKVPN
jgi:hypothetical protein